MQQSPIKFFSTEGAVLDYKPKTTHGLLHIGDFTTPHHFEIPFSDPNKLTQKINKILRSIPSIRFQYDENKYSWSISYGTFPMELTIHQEDYSLIRIIKQKKWWAMKAALKALDKYEDNWHDNDYNYAIDDNPLRWCRMELRLFYKELNNTILVEPYRHHGDDDIRTFYYILQNFINKEILLENNI